MDPFLFIPCLLLVFAIGGIIGSRYPGRTRDYDEGYHAGWSDHAAFVARLDDRTRARAALRAECENAEISS